MVSQVLLDVFMHSFHLTFLHICIFLLFLVILDEILIRLEPLHLLLSQLDPSLLQPHNKVSLVLHEVFGQYFLEVVFFIQLVY